MEADSTCTHIHVVFTVQWIENSLLFKLVYHPFKMKRLTEKKKCEFLALLRMLEPRKPRTHLPSWSLLPASVEATLGRSVFSSWPLAWTTSRTPRAVDCAH